MDVPSRTETHARNAVRVWAYVGKGTYRDARRRDVSQRVSIMDSWRNHNNAT